MKTLCALLLVASSAFASQADQWLGFRGDGSSLAPEASPPTDWSVESGSNVAWTADLPGRGVSGPIVAGGRVLVTASDGPLRERLHVLAFDEQTGERLWARQLWATGRTNCHPTSANAAPTPTSDGQRVFVFYSSNDLAAFDLNGNLLWFRGLTLDHPGVGNDVGMASSPAVVGDALVVQAECQGKSFAIAVDPGTGKTIWEIDRPKSSNWTSPLAWVTEAGKPAIWLQDRSGASLHDAGTGEQIARIDASCDGTISPMAAGENRLVLPTGGVSVFAAPFDEPLLQASKLQPGSPSPVVWKNQVLVINRGGVLACGDLATGDIVWRRRLGGRFWATPVAAGGRLYCVNAAGQATVVDLLNGGEVLSKSEFGEDVLGSPAVAGDAVYFRSEAHLWKIAAIQQASAPRPTTSKAR